MQTIITKYHGPTNSRNARVSATAAGGTKIYHEWDDVLSPRSNMNAAALAMCHKMAWTGRMHSGEVCDAAGGGRVYVFDNGDRALEVK